jgi:hypothetical protein
MTTSSTERAAMDRADQFGVLKEFREACHRAEDIGWVGDVEQWMDEAADPDVNRAGFLDFVDWMTAEVEEMESYHQLRQLDRV